MRRILVPFVLAGDLVLVMLGFTRAVAPPRVEKPRVDAVGDPLPDDALARFGSARFRDSDFLAAVVLSPDGKLLAVPALDEIRLLDTATGKQVRRIKGEDRSFRSFRQGTITFSPDGRVLAFSDQDGIVICDLTKGEVLSQFHTGLRFRQAWVSFSGDGKLVAVEGQDSQERPSITIWDVAEKKEKKKIELTHMREVWATLSPDGKTLVTWGQGPNRLLAPVQNVLDVNTGKERMRLKPEGSALQNVVFSPDGRHIVVLEAGSLLSVRAVATGELLRQFVACMNTSIVLYSPEGKRLATASANGTVQIWDTLSGRRLAQCNAPPQTQIASIAFMKDGKVLAAGISYEMIRIWEVPSGRERTPAVGHLARVAAVAFSRDCKTLLSGGPDGVRMRSLATGKEVRRFEPRPDPFGRRSREFNRSIPYLSANGRYLALADQHGQGLTVVDLNSGEEIAGVDPRRGQFGNAVAFAPDGVGLVVLGSGVAHVWDLQSGLLKRKVKVSARGLGSSLALSRGGKVVVIATALEIGDGAAERIALWNVATGKETTRLPITSANKMAFSPDGSMLATSASGRVSLWDAVIGQLVLHLEVGENRTLDPIAFSPDGRLLAVAIQAPRGEADEIRLWELASGNVRTSFTGHRGGTLSLVFSRDGRMLASGGMDTTVMLWDVTGVAALSRLRQHKPSLAERAALWADLDNTDARTAHKAMARLLAWPAETMTLFRKELKPAAGKPPEEKDIQRWIVELGDESYEVREKATKALSAAGRAARSSLLTALTTSSDLEKKRRLEALLRTLRPRPMSEAIRLTRALEVLERMGTPEARKMLQRLARGNPSARLTSDAADVLKRLEQAR